MTGVVLTHGSIIESLIAAHEVFGRRDDRVLQFSDYTFDVSVWVRISSTLRDEIFAYFPS